MVLKFDKDVVEASYFNILVGFTPFLLGERLLYSKHLTPSEVFEANAHLLRLRMEYSSQRLMDERECLLDARSKGLWSDTEETEINTLQGDIAKKQGVLRHAFLPSQIKQIQAEIRLLKEKLVKILTKRHSLVSMSLEGKILSDKMDFLLFVSIYSSLKERLWPTFDDFQNEEEDKIGLISRASDKELANITTPLIRCIARSTDSRHRLKTVQSGPDTSIFLMELLGWCNFYNSVYDLEDKPSDEIIEDDELLDGWLMSRRLKAKSQSHASVNNGEGFVSYVGATKQDMEMLGGVNRDQAINLAQKK